MQTVIEKSRATTSRSKYRWRVVDIVVASVLGVASGIIFWAWGLAWTPLSGLLAFTPGLEGLLAGGWLFAGVLGGLVIRKPGAAIFTELVAAVVSAPTAWISAAPAGARNHNTRRATCPAPRALGAPLTAYPRQ